MSDIQTYDAQVQAIEAYNKPILDDFQSWLEQSNLAQKTANRYVKNIQLFTLYLVYYEPLKKLDEASSSDVRMFLNYWFPRKVGWSVTSITLHLAAFKKFFQQGNRILILSTILALCKSKQVALAIIFIGAFHVRLALA